MTLEGLLEALKEQATEPNVLPPNLDITAKVLQDMLPDYTRPCRFKVGDLVVPRKSKSVRWRQSLGVAIVTKVLDAEVISTDDVPAHRNDMVILCKKADFMAELLVCSRDFVDYRGPVA